MGRGAHAPPIGPRCASTGQHHTPTAQLTRSFMSTGCLTPPINTGSRDSTDFASNSRSPHARNPQKPRNTGVLLSLPATNAGASHAVLVGNQAQRPWAWTPHDPQTPASLPQPNAPEQPAPTSPTHAFANAGAPRLNNPARQPQATHPTSAQQATRSKRVGGTAMRWCRPPIGSGMARGRLRPPWWPRRAARLRAGSARSQPG